MDVDDDEIHSLNRKSARVRGNGSQLSSENSIIHRARKSSRNRDRTRRKSPTEIDLNSKTTPAKLKLFAKADKHLEHIAQIRNSGGNGTLNGSKSSGTSPILRKQPTRAFKRNNRYPPIGEAIKDTTKLGQTWIKENQLGNLKKNRKKAEQKKAKQKKRAEIFSSDDENDPSPIKNAGLPVNNGLMVPQPSSESNDTELQRLLYECGEGSKRESFWKKKDKSKKVEILAPDTPELDRRGPKVSATNCIISESDSE